ncbi:hypothetical protein LI328DRAFT_81289 [Trichoderma asperelloides]|nr:hypothetical protein LI328DRAFT_81289 [Trichoderma asperelloides]
MTSGGADVKLIFWEIACPGKARFRACWTTHQSRVTAGVSSTLYGRRAPGASRYRPSVSPFDAETAPLTPFFVG